MKDNNRKDFVGTNPDWFQVQIAGAFTQAERIMVSSSIIRLDGMLGLCIGAPHLPIDFVFKDPNLESLDDTLGRLVSRGELDSTLKLKAGPPRDVVEAKAAIRTRVRRALELLEQTVQFQSAIIASYDRLSTGEVRVRAYVHGDVSTKAILVQGPNAVFLCGHDPLSFHFEPAAAVAVVDSGGFYDDAANWYGRVWDLAIDVAAIFMEEFRASWAMAACSPYFAYLHMAWHYLRLHDGKLESQLVWADARFARLAEFQLDAVRQAVRIIEAHNGCFVADVVGLGKSFIGAGLLKYFQLSAELRPLVICPAPLVSMWEQQCEDWDLNARVVSVGALTDNSELAPAFRLEDNRLRFREIVLIDESHLFRNDDNQRYQLLSQFLSSGRRVILLSATPMNRSPYDIYHQLKLFHQQERTRLPVSPALLRPFFDQVERGQARLQDLLPHVLVRRTRRDIVRAYGRDAVTGARIRAEDLAEYASGQRRAVLDLAGRSFSFPTRILKTVSYSMEATYGPGVYGQIRDMLVARAQRPGPSLRYARYRRLDYVLPAHRHLYAQLAGTANSLSGLMRSLLFKRLESSTAAFLGTTRRMHESISRMLQAVESGQVLQSDDAEELAASSDDHLQFADIADTGGVRIEHLDRHKFASDLRSDRGVLEAMIAIVSSVDSRRNAKLLALRRLIDEGGHAASKVLVFTQFHETATMIHEAMSQWYPSKVVACCTGTAGDRARIPVRFSPRSHPDTRLRAHETEIDMLVSSDVLSEGVNLQQCNLVINFDLHWNPVRLIQRFGRVDRIGSAHESILAFNFLPELALDANLGLQARLSEQIREIHEVIGEDSAILDPRERLNEDAMYAIYEAERLSDDGVEGAGAENALSDAASTLAALERDNRLLLDSIAALPLGQRAARACLGDSPYALVLMRAGTEMRFYRGGPHASPVHIAAEQGFAEACCSPEEPSIPIPNWLGDVVEAAKRHFRDELELRAGDWRSLRRGREGQRQALQRLQICAKDHAQDPRATARIEELLTMIQCDLPDPVVRALRELDRRSLEDGPFLDEVSKLCLTYQLRKIRDASRDLEQADVEVVTSMAFVPA